MIEVSRSLHEKAALAWTDIYQAVLRFVERFNNIIADNIASKTLTRDLFKQYEVVYPSGSVRGWLNAELIKPEDKSYQSYPVCVNFTRLEADRYGQYLLSWSVELERRDTDTDGQITGTLAEVSVDGIRVPAADDCAMALFPSGDESEYRQQTDHGYNDERIVMSGYGTVLLLPGVHSVNIVVTPKYTMRVKTASAVLARIGL